MKILTWGGDNVPPTHAWCARFQVGKSILPAIIYAATEEAVIAKAQAFWDAETEKARNRMVGKHRRPQTTEERINERGQPETVEEADAPSPDGVGSADGGLDENGLIPGNKGARPVATPTNDDLDDLLG